MRHGAHKEHAGAVEGFAAQDEAARRELAGDVVRLTGYIERVGAGLSTVRAHAADVQHKRAALLERVGAAFAGVRRRLAD